MRVTPFFRVITMKKDSVFRCASFPIINSKTKYNILIKYTNRMDLLT